MIRIFPTYAKDPRVGRHARALVGHATPAKLANLARVEREYRSRAVALRGMPYVYFVDVCNYCDLKCPLCPSALDTFGRTRGMIRLAEYERIIERIAPYAFEVNLHNWGEPFLNPDILGIMEATRRRNVLPNVSTNMNSLDPSLAEDVVRSGLEYLVCSIDGTTSRVYSRYRVGGDFDRVMENLRALVAAKRKLRSATPTIEWQFLVMGHNEHQMEDARRIAEEIGVDCVRFAPAGLPFEQLTDAEEARAWMPRTETYRRFDPARLNGMRFYDRHHCHFLYRSMTIGPVGAVAPCCAVHSERDDIGSIATEDLAAVWNNNAYRSARALFAGEGDGAGTPCARCAMFARPQLQVAQEVSA